MSPIRVVLFFALLLEMISLSLAQDGPKVEVTNIRKVFHNGEHNAFTDLVKFKDRFYLTFRSCPDGHMVHPTASIIILSSLDLNRWEEVHRFHVAKRDTRDPHFLIHEGRIGVLTGTWYSGDTTLPRNEYDLNKHLGYSVWSNDGSKWEGPTLLEGTFGHYVWRAASHNGMAYLCGRRKHEFDVRPKGEGPEVESALLESQDGVHWRMRSLFQEVDGDETAFQFESDGSLLAIGRRGSKPAQILRSKPPYTMWDRKELDRYIGGPLLIRWGDRWVVGGRKNKDAGGAKTAMYWLINDRLQEFAELPSAGDNSYPGFVELSPTKGVMSWYSSHEKDAQGKAITAIYMADLTIQ